MYWRRIENAQGFVDYQNVYKLARRAFAGPDSWPSTGQIHPDLAGVLFQAKRNQTYGGTENETELGEVRIYRGMPDGALDPKGHGAASRQIAHWERHPDVAVFSHPLAYPRGWENEWDRAASVRSGEKPREKGIDVQRAVDLVLGAVHDEYDVAVVFSGDSDLLPAIRAAMTLGSTLRWRHGVPAINRLPGYPHVTFQRSRMELQGSSGATSWMRRTISSVATT